jgi:hypothetical protein
MQKQVRVWENDNFYCGHGSVILHRQGAGLKCCRATGGQLAVSAHLLNSAFMHDNEERRVREVLDAVLARLIAQDLDLLVLDVHERTITAKLAGYMQELLPEWTVDPEYNRIRGRVKEVRLDGELVLVVPDVIAHRRNTGDNFLVLEAKKIGDPEAEAYDRRKIRALKEQQHYRYAVFLRLRTSGENPGVESVEWL